MQLEKTIKDKFDDQRIKVQYFLDSSLQNNLSKLIVDKKFSLVVEIKDDTKDNPYEAIGMTTYSNEESVVLIHDSMFEMLGIQTELYQTNRTK